MQVSSAAVMECSKSRRNSPWAKAKQTAKGPVRVTELARGAMAPHSREQQNVCPLRSSPTERGCWASLGARVLFCGDGKLGGWRCCLNPAGGQQPDCLGVFVETMENRGRALWDVEGLDGIGDQFGVVAGDLAGDAELD